MNKKKTLSLSWIVLVFLGLVSCQQPDTKPVTLKIFAGMSLKIPLEEIKEIYSLAKPNVTLDYKLAQSIPLKQEIEQGATADIFIPAGAEVLDDLQSKDLLLPETRQKFLSNEIVLIAPKEATNISSFQDLASPPIKKVVLGDLTRSRSGIHAQEVLTSLKIFAQVKPKIIFVPDASQVLRAIEMGKADAGVTFATDAILSNQVRIVAIAPENSHSPVYYSLVILKNSKNTSEAREFIQFLQSDQAGSIFVKYGFAIPNLSEPSE